MADDGRFMRAGMGKLSLREQISEFLGGIGGNLSRFVPPEAREHYAKVPALLEFASKFTDAADVRDYSEGTQEAIRNALAGKWGDAGMSALQGGLGLAGVLLPGLSGAGKLGKMDLPAMKDIRPARENLQTVLRSNFRAGRVVGDEMAPIAELSGGAASSARAQDRIAQLAKQIGGPNGYIERLIVDQDGNVIEGAHRLEALRRLGVTEVPITRVADAAAAIDVPKVEAAIRAIGPMRSDHVNQIIEHASEMVAEAGSPQAALEMFELPAGFERQFEAALKAMK